MASCWPLSLSLKAEEGLLSFLVGLSPKAHNMQGVSISLVSLYASEPGFGVMISSCLDWLPFAIYYSLSSPSSFPLKYSTLKTAVWVFTSEEFSGIQQLRERKTCGKFLSLLPIRSEFLRRENSKS